MGYNTTYQLRVIDKPVYIGNVDLTAFIDEFIPETQTGIMTLMVDTNGSYLQSDCEARWYQHEQDMLRLSASYPDLVFQLDGQGEDAEDRWRKYFKSGKFQSAKAVITLEPYDPKKLLRKQS